MIRPTGWQRGPRLAAALGAPGLIIGALSLLSFGFSLLVLLDEYHNPTQTGRSALHQVFEGWVRVGDYLGYTLVDRVERWQVATGADRSRAELLIRRAVADLGEGLTRDDPRFRLVRLDRLDLGSGRSAPLVTWRPASSSLVGPSVASPLSDRIPVSPGKGPDRPAVELVIHYHVIEPIAAAGASVARSYHRLVLALLGLSGYSLLCLGYMARHALTQQERVAREAAAAATLDLADRTCHELGQRCLRGRQRAARIWPATSTSWSDSSPMEAAVLASRPPSRRAGIGPESPPPGSNTGPPPRAYAERGIDPEFELKGSAAIARDVCRQIATCSDFIALTVRELDSAPQANGRCRAVAARTPSPSRRSSPTPWRSWPRGSKSCAEPRWRSPINPASPTADRPRRSPTPDPCAREPDQERDRGDRGAAVADSPTLLRVSVDDRGDKQPLDQTISRRRAGDRLGAT